MTYRKGEAAKSILGGLATLMSLVALIFLLTALAAVAFQNRFALILFFSPPGFFILAFVLACVGLYRARRSRPRTDTSWAKIGLALAVLVGASWAAILGWWLIFAIGMINGDRTPERSRQKRLNHSIQQPKQALKSSSAKRHLRHALSTSRGFLSAGRVHTRRREQSTLRGV